MFVSTVPLTGDMYQLIMSAGGGANPTAPLPGYAPVSSNIFAYSDFFDVP